MYTATRCLFILIAVGLTGSIACESDVTSSVNKFPAEETFSYEVAAEARSNFRLIGINGTVELTGSPGAESIVISGVRRVESHSQSDARKRLAGLTVEIDSTDTSVEVRTEQPADTEGRNYLVNYTVTLTDDFDVTIVTANGNVTVRSLKNGVTVSCANAAIVGSAIEGDTEMTVANGSIDTTVMLPPGGRITLGAANGSIHLKIPTDTSAEFAANIANGRIGIKNLTLSNITTTPTRVTGTLGDGNGSIELDTANGDIIAEGI
jgi:hypothetical protein